MIADMDEKKDILIQLNNVNYEDDWEDDFMKRRSIIWTLSFTAKSYIYGPYHQSGLIQKAIVYDGFSTPSGNVRATRLTYTPTPPDGAQDVNGDGVIDLSDYGADDDFGFNEGIEILL